ncbi:hypothetical protein ASC77_13050 [Nocardioides sp. Root1257]|uniref:hypothetical protein n=1 Tax=unclassified Nocardioides TaxID=2615069 RepID=UPI0006FFD3A4|nr:MULTISPECIES: hypothetical protein [unclassified Nocardioides]KQW47389.1 hypothetical protein ASC77_13050 [Nocardioides sp. Root1257]KRC45545.1 hypothetical protein ASE24_13055 [Nocardioides sp. Root224]
MGTPILVRGDDSKWREPEVTSYENEAALQQLVADSPDLLTGKDLATVDEFWIPEVGSVDIVGVGADGGVTVVECKLRANPEIRREVVGQVLAYAGGLWQMDYEAFAATWSARAGRPLLDHVAEKTGATESDQVRTGIETSLRTGEFTLVIVVDEITGELKRIIEWLNVMTRQEVSVLALELQYLKEGSTEILVPRLYGEALASAKRSPSSTNGHKWSAESFAAAIAELDVPAKAAVTDLMAHGEESGLYPWWGVGQTPGMSWYYQVGPAKVSLFQIYLRPNGATVAASVGGLFGATGLGPSTASQMLDGLRDIPAIAPYVAHVTNDALNKYPSIPVTDVLDQEPVREAFLRVIDEVRTRPQI